MAFGCALSAACTAADPQHTETLTTRNGLALALDDERQRLIGISIADWHMDSSDDIRGPSVRLARADGTVLVDDTVPGRWTRSRNPIPTVHRTRASSSHGVRIDESWLVHSTHIELVTEIEVAPGGPLHQPLEACVRVPIDVTGMGARWHHHLHHSELIEPGRTYQTLLTEAVDIGHWSRPGQNMHLKSDLPINLHGLSVIGNETLSLAVAVPPDRPAAHYTAYDAAQRELRTCFHLGIYGQHQTQPTSVEFALAFFHPDRPAWGLRSALDTLISIYPEAFRGTLPRQTGMTVDSAYRYNLYPEPATFHIGAMWNGIFAENRRKGVKSLAYSWPTGFYDRGMRLASRPVDGPCPDCDGSLDAHVAACLNIYADYDAGQSPFPQVCSGLWDLSQCRRDEAAVLRRYGPVRTSSGYSWVEPVRVVEPSNLLLRLFGQMAMHAPLSASLLRDANGQFRGAMSAAQALTAASGTSEDGAHTCILNGFNPDPGIGHDSTPAAPRFLTGNMGELNLDIARRVTGVYGPDYIHVSGTTPQLYDGMAVDTVGAYLRPDFHEAMLRIASLPLSHDRQTGRVVALEHVSLTAFLRALRQALPTDSAIAVNGAPISGLLATEADFFIRELGRRLRLEPGDAGPRLYDELYEDSEAMRIRHVHRIRMAAYQRPITFWARFWRTEEDAAALGQTPEEALLAAMERFLPLYTAQGIYVYLPNTGLAGGKSMFAMPQAPAVQTAYQRHLDAVHALTEAGWQPIPHATTSDSAVLVERFGTEFITVYNPADSATQLTVDMDWAAMGHAQAPMRIVDVLTGEELETVPAAGGHRAVPALAVDPHGARILRIVP